MTKYANKIKRKKLVKKVLGSVIRKLSAVSSETDHFTTLDKVIWKDIKAGLDYGIDVKYTMFDYDNYMPSLEIEYESYFKRSGTEKELELVYTALTDKLLPSYISKYEDLELIKDEDEYGNKYFEIKFK